MVRNYTLFSLLFASAVSLKAMEPHSITLSVDEASHYGMTLLQQYLDRDAITIDEFARVSHQLSERLSIIAQDGIEQSAVDAVLFSLMHHTPPTIIPVVSHHQQQQHMVMNDDAELEVALAASLAQMRQDEERRLRAMHAQTTTTTTTTNNNNIAHGKRAAIVPQHNHMNTVHGKKAAMSQHNDMNNSEHDELQQAIALSQQKHYPLHDAVKAENEELVDRLLAQKVKADGLDAQGHTPWFYAKSMNMKAKAAAIAAKDAQNTCCVCMEKVGRTLFATGSDDCLHFICRDCKKANDEKYYPYKDVQETHHAYTTNIMSDSAIERFAAQTMEQQNPNYWVIRGCPVCKKGYKDSKETNQ